MVITAILQILLNITIHQTYKNANHPTIVYTQTCSKMNGKTKNISHSLQSNIDFYLLLLLIYNSIIPRIIVIKIFELVIQTKYLFIRNRYVDDSNSCGYIVSNHYSYKRNKVQILLSIKIYMYCYLTHFLGRTNPNC